MLECTHTHLPCGENTVRVQCFNKLPEHLVFHNAEWLSVLDYHINQVLIHLILPSWKKDVFPLLWYHYHNHLIKFLYVPCHCTFKWLTWSRSTSAVVKPDLYFITHRTFRTVSWTSSDVILIFLGCPERPEFVSWSGILEVKAWSALSVACERHPHPMWATPGSVTFLKRRRHSRISTLHLLRKVLK